MFAAALFTIARLWNQLMCLLTDEQTEKIHGGVLFSHKEE
jgi:hypothetical protein